TSVSPAAPSARGRSVRVRGRSRVRPALATALAAPPTLPATPRRHSYDLSSRAHRLCMVATILARRRLFRRRHRPGHGGDRPIRLRGQRYGDVAGEGGELLLQHRQGRGQVLLQHVLEAILFGAERLDRLVERLAPLLRAGEMAFGVTQPLIAAGDRRLVAVCGAAGAEVRGDLRVDAGGTEAGEGQLGGAHIFTAAAHLPLPVANAIGEPFKLAGEEVVEPFQRLLRLGAVAQQGMAKGAEGVDRANIGGKAHAGGLWEDGLALGQVLVRLLRLAQQEGDLLVCGLDELLQHLHGLVELGGEAGVLLVPPGVAQRLELPLQAAHALPQLVVERAHAVGEALQRLGTDDRLLRHGSPRWYFDAVRAALHAARTQPPRPRLQYLLSSRWHGACIGSARK